MCPSTYIALNGRDGHKFSHAPHPMQRASLIAGIFTELSSPTFEGIIVIAPAGQWRAQLPHSTPSVNGTQFFFIHTACPIRIELFSSIVIGLIAPVGQTSEQRVHSGRQYPLSYDISGCINDINPVDGRNTPFGHADTHN